MISKEPFYQYVENVLAGREVVGKYIRLAVERFVNDCDKKDFKFDYEEGRRIVNFAAKVCRHWKGPKAGQPIIFDPHQQFYFIQKYGWLNTDTGLPRFRRTYKQIARKTGKTTEAAIEALYHMTKGQEEAAQVWTCAVKEDDAVILVNDAGRIAQASPKLAGRFKFRITEPYIRRVIYPERNAFMAFMTAGQDAVDTSMGFGDECHDWADASVKQRITSSMGNRMAPTFTNITTAGFDKSTYCYATLRDTAIKILEGVASDEAQLILMYELDENDDWKNQEMWIKANPNMPYSLTQKAYLENEFVPAVNEGGTTEVNFKTKNLDMWVDAPSVWIQTETWVRNQHGISENDLIGKRCFGGLDLVSGGDMNALVLFFPNIRGEIHAVKLFCWKPASIQVEAKYANNVVSCHGDVVDNQEAVEKIWEEIGNYNLHSIAFFNASKTHEIVQSLVRNGVQCDPIPHSYQGVSTPTKAWEENFRAVRMEHFGNPLFNWMNSNCTILRNGNEKMVQKLEGRTCGVIAGINALAQYLTISANEEEAGIEEIEL